MFLVLWFHNFCQGIYSLVLNRIPWSTLKDSTDTMRFMHLNLTNKYLKKQKKKQPVTVSVLSSKAQRGPHASGSTAVP